MGACPEPSIVLTGCGWVTPAAAGTLDEVLAAAARSTLPPAPAERYWPMPDERMAAYPDLPREMRDDKGAQLAAIALDQARRDAHLDPDTLDDTRVGLALGYGLAGQLGMIQFANEVREQSPRFVTPIHFPQTVGNYIAGALARGYDIRGPSITLASGSASALDAIVEGCGFLDGGGADVVFAGGIDTFSPELAGGLADRSPGLTLAEGACLFVLERAEDAAARGVVPLAGLTAWHQTTRDAPPPAASDTVLSCATGPHAGGVFIGHWVGRCPGADGAAALAAAIGAGRGHAVPIVDTDDPAAVAMAAIAADDPRRTGDGLRATIIADADGAHRTTLEIIVPPG